MLLKTFKSNRTLNYVVFPLAGLLLWGRRLFHPVSYPFYSGEADNILYAPVDWLIGGFPFLQVLPGFILLIVLAFIMLYMNNRYSLIGERTMLPLSLFIILVSGFTDLQVMHPVYAGAIFFLLAIFRLFSSFDQIKPYSAAFDSGFFLGIASLFYINLVILFPAFFFGIGILSRESRWRKFVIIVAGFILPFVFAFGFSYLNGEWLEYMKILELNFITPNNHLKANIPLQVYTGSLILLAILGSFKIIRQYDSKKVSTRRYFAVFFLIFSCSVLGVILIPAVSSEMFVISSIPLTFLISNLFVYQKKRIWSELWLGLLLLMVIAFQFIS